MPEASTSPTFTPALGDLVVKALDLALMSRRDGPALVPFVLIESENTHYIRRFAAANDEQAVTDAKLFVVRLPGANSCAITYDGTITIEGIPFNAIVVVACEPDIPNTFVFAQRYDASAAPIALMGSPAFLGAYEPLADTLS